VVEGKEITGEKNIQQALVNFYGQLYTSKEAKDIDSLEYMQNTYVPKVSDQDKGACDAIIIKEEIKRVVISMRNNKSPGSDGLPAEFYKTFWDDVEDLFIEMTKEAYKKGELPPTLKKAILTLIFKKGDKVNIGNYRPISLTNVEYKVITVILANCLQKCLHT
jgi:hypothetical protein